MAIGDRIEQTCEQRRNDQAERCITKKETENPEGRNTGATEKAGKETLSSRKMGSREKPVSHEIVDQYEKNTLTGIDKIPTNLVEVENSKINSDIDTEKCIVELKLGSPLEEGKGVGQGTTSNVALGTQQIHDGESVSAAPDGGWGWVVVVGAFLSSV